MKLIENDITYLEEQAEVYSTMTFRQPLLTVGYSKHQLDLNRHEVDFRMTKTSENVIKVLKR